jgi:cyclohexanecarboxylate-CoA ligase
MAQRHGSDGRPLPGCTVRAVDAAGQVVAPGVEGELEIHGPQLCVGYLDPDLNGAFTSDGALRTGDLGIVDSAGYVRITGRRKDVIIRKGETLSAREIEDVLAAHSQIAEAAVVGLPDPARGELVCACVVPVASAPLSLDEVRVFMEAQGVMRQKIPERLELMAQLPRNATGKIQKDALRARLSATPGSRSDPDRQFRS